MARTGLDGHRSTTSSPRWSYGMAHENPRWEYKRIEGELLKFGFCRSSAESERRLATFVAPPDDPFRAERVWLSVSERNLAVADASSLPGRIPRAASWGAVLSPTRNGSHENPRTQVLGRRGDRRGRGRIVGHRRARRRGDVRAPGSLLDDVGHDLPYCDELGRHAD